MKGLPYKRRQLPRSLSMRPFCGMVTGREPQRSILNRKMKGRNFLVTRIPSKPADNILYIPIQRVSHHPKRTDDLRLRIVSANSQQELIILVPELPSSFFIVSRIGEVICPQVDHNDIRRKP